MDVYWDGLAFLRFMHKCVLTSDVVISVSVRMACLSCRSGEPFIVQSSVPEVLLRVVWGCLIEQDDMSSVEYDDSSRCSTRRYVLLFGKEA